MKTNDIEEMVGRTGRVTGTIAPGTIGEVRLAIRGGAETFYAYCIDGEERLEKGRHVVVVEYEPPRTVYVTAL